MINVIIPAYNCSKTLGRTLASLVAQTDQNFEVIIIDDCSTENIKNIIDDYNNKLKIIYIRNENNPLAMECVQFLHSFQEAVSLD